ncbi:MAG TPA: TIGR03767 family metallophosphoesterase [Mycobacteriales bacterium]|nr:TIGR03767 family metallophosphoesterase [Mycobacteriales bacterium]
MTTVERRLVPGVRNDRGYRALEPAPGEPHCVYADDGVELPEGWREVAVPLLVLAQLSDLHVMDAQSPARFELIDRYADPDSPWRAELPEIGMYRPQEPFTTHVVAAMVQAVNAARCGPVSGAPVEVVVVTGDMTDNAQRNELRNYLGLLDGGTVIEPGSGQAGVWEGVGGVVDDDERYWHPDGARADLAAARGLPRADGLLAAATTPFPATGLDAPWLAVHGNHDLLIQGTVPSTGRYAGISTGTDKAVTAPDGLDAAGLVAALYDCRPQALDLLVGSRRVTVTSDPDRRHVTRAEHVAAHLDSPGSPPGHGYTEDNRARDTAYYTWDSPAVRCVVLDTVNEHGGWQGCLDRAQFAWLEAVLAAADRPTVLFSHHPLETLVNDRHPRGFPSPVLVDELREMLLRHTCLVAWVNGHTHEHRVTAQRRADGSLAWWQITTASHIDWPQQARIVELLQVGARLVIGATVLDHAGEVSWSGRLDPIGLAGLSREIAANNWQRPAGEPADGAGQPSDRNVILVSRMPLAAAVPSVVVAD